MGMTEEKQTLRKQVLARRSALSAQERERFSAQAVRHLQQLEPLAGCRTVLIFYPFRDEIDTRAFMALAARRGQEIWLPLTDTKEKEIVPYLYAGEESLRQGVWGIREPNPDIAQRANLELLEAIVVPGVAFDSHGGRLGYGGGYYDRFLAKLERKPPLIGFAFSCQLVDQVPLEEHDYLLDYLVTENGVTRFQRPRVSRQSSAPFEK